MPRQPVVGAPEDLNQHKSELLCAEWGTCFLGGMELSLHFGVKSNQNYNCDDQER